MKYGVQNLAVGSRRPDFTHKYKCVPLYVMIFHEWHSYLALLIVCAPLTRPSSCPTVLILTRRSFVATSFLFTPSCGLIQSKEEKDKLIKKKHYFWNSRILYWDDTRRGEWLAACEANWLHFDTLKVYFFSTVLTIVVYFLSIIIISSDFF